jgi:hypothetical protein
MPEALRSKTEEARRDPGPSWDLFKAPDVDPMREIRSDVVEVEADVADADAEDDGLTPVELNLAKLPRRLFCDCRPPLRP